MRKFVFTEYAQKRFYKCSHEAQERILKKLKDIKDVENIHNILKKLKNFDPATHRLRVGKYRLILRKENDKKFFILDVGHRKEIYK